MGDVLIHSEELEELIDSTVTIPTIPTTLLEINRIFSSEDGSAHEASVAIEKDPAIAAKLLRLVNSSFYGLKETVSEIGLACSILGLKVIRNLVIQATVIEEFKDCSGLSNFDTSFLWDHSFKTAVAARALVEASPAAMGIGKEEAYTCGLIHDVGKMILLQSTPERFAEALEHSEKSDLPLAKAEAELFGFSHAHVGGLLAERWKLSESIQAAVAFHHSPGSAPEKWVQGFLIHAANSVAHQMVEGSGGWIPDLADDDELQLLGIEAEQWDEIRELVASSSGSF